MPAANTRVRHMLAWTNGEMPLVAFRVHGWPALWWASMEAVAREALEAVGLRPRFAAAEPGVLYRDGKVAVRAGRMEELKVPR